MFNHGEGRRLPTVLLIDDDTVSREVLATILTMSGYTVQAAPGGDDALRLLDNGGSCPDVILMDTQMPGISGGALIEQLRRRSRAVVYAISGSQAPTEVVNRADGFLLKPLGPEALQQLLRTHWIQEPNRDPSTAPVIHLETLAQFRALMPELAVREIYDAVLVDLEKRQTLLESAIEREDRDGLRRIGHALKGGCGMAGALQAAQLGEMLEIGGDDLDYSRSVIAQLKGATARLKRMLALEFSPQGSDPVI